MLSSKFFGFGINGTDGLASSFASVIAVVVLRTVDLKETSEAPLKDLLPSTTEDTNANMMDESNDVLRRTSSKKWSSRIPVIPLAPTLRI